MSNPPTPPIAAPVPHHTTIFGEALIDDYYWMRERANPDVIAHLEAENRYTMAYLRPTEPLQQLLYTELVGYIRETDSSAPAPHGGFHYTERTEAGKQYKLHYRISQNGDEQLLLDQNSLADGQSYFRLGMFKISPNQRLLAYTTDTNGSERFNLFVKDLATGQIVDGPIPNVSYDLEWANDNQTLFYGIPDDSWRTNRLFRHQLGSDACEDALLFEEHDSAFNLQLRKTRSAAFLVIASKSNTTSEEYLLSADQPGAALQLIAARRHGIQYYTQHNGNYLYIQTNEDALNFKIVRIPVEWPSAPAEEVVPHHDQICIDWIELFANHLVLIERESGLEQIRIIDLATHEQHRISFPEPVYSVTTDGPHFNADDTTTRIRFTYSSPVTPPNTVDYDMVNRVWTVVKQQDIPGYDPTRYRCERIFAQAADGVQVPISIVRPINLPFDGSQPLLLYGYGAYGATIDPAFDFKRIPLLERGFTYAIAHIRGGGELGRAWYEDGKLLKKPNTFTDFIACAEHLIALGYTRSDRLVIKGRSAGGLLMGAVVTMRPDLFQAVIAGVPFVDVINTSLDPSIPLVVAEYEEWGDPGIREQYECLRSFSPYENITSTAYPNILATAGLYDPRVQYWEPAKWVAKLRALKTDQNVVLLKTEMVGGHAGPSGRYDYLRDIAFEYAFLLNALGLLEAS
ncbi:MAG: S9 family peptidase [Roseiflexaceae bacterium]|nr:S9 family peptidase [Roseiflexaceae bacterium]